MAELGKMTESSTGPLYDLWAKIYDHSFGALVRTRQVRAIEELQPHPGDLVLDLGVGTGGTLPHYPRNVRVVGMDLSKGMLDKAADKRREHGWNHVTLLQGDAMHPPFKEHCFDHIVISHTVSVVSDPNGLMQWVQRLVKPTGRVIVLNHFQSEQPAIATLEKVLNPVCVKVGWRSDLSLSELLEGTRFEVDHAFKLRTIDFWQIVVLRVKTDAHP